MKILTFAGSLRKDSWNKKLCLHVAKLVHQNNLAEIEFLDVGALDIPVFNEDIEKSFGLPTGVEILCKKISAADSLIVSTPEYNGSIPGALKNILDWVSRKKPDPVSGKYVMLLAASPGYFGGVRSLWHTRVPFEVVGAYVYPEMYGLPKAHEAFDTEGNLKDERAIQIIDQMLKKYISHLSLFVREPKS